MHNILAEQQLAWLREHMPVFAYMEKQTLDRIASEATYKRIYRPTIALTESRVYPCH